MRTTRILRRYGSCIEFGWPFVAALASISVALAIFFFLAYGVWREQTIGLDAAVLELVVTAASPGLTVVMKAITSTGSVWFVGTVLALLSLRWWRTRRNDVLALGITALGSVVFNETLKALFSRPRPSLYPPLVNALGYSFPSGHSTIAIAFLGVLAYLIGRRLAPGPRLAVYATAAVWIVLVGFSRTYLGVHYASDVIGAYAVTLPWVAAIVAVHACSARLQAGGIPDERQMPLNTGDPPLHD
jgi:undecaprenyl-diphosphatase